MLITDPTKEDMPRVMAQTYNLTIQRISHIRSLYGIEREFDRYYLRLKNKLSTNMNLRQDKDVMKF